MKKVNRKRYNVHVQLLRAVSPASLRAAYRFQLAGYRDEQEYLSVNQGSAVSENRLVTAHVHVCVYPYPACRWTGGLTITT